MDYYLADMQKKGLAEVEPIKGGDELLALLRRQMFMRVIIRTCQVCGISEAYDSYLNLSDNTRPTKRELDTLRPTATIKVWRN